MEQVLRLPIPPGMRDVPVLAVDLPSLNEQQRHAAFSSHRGPGPGPGPRPRTGGIGIGIGRGPGNTTSTTGVNTWLGPNIVRGLTLSETSTVRHVTQGSFTYSPQLGVRSLLAVAPPVVTVQQVPRPLSRPYLGPYLSLSSARGHRPAGT